MIVILYFQRIRRGNCTTDPAIVPVPSAMDLQPHDGHGMSPREKQTPWLVEPCSAVGQNIRIRSPNYITSFLCHVPDGKYSESINIDRPQDRNPPNRTNVWNLRYDLLVSSRSPAKITHTTTPLRITAERETCTRVSPTSHPLIWINGNIVEFLLVF
jgi:hypothetical protein